MSSSRLCVRISNCSRLFLSIWGERFTVNFSMRVGSGMGARTSAPVRFAMFTISLVDASRMRWSKALSLILMFWLCISMASTFRSAPLLAARSFASLFDDRRHDASTHGAAALADGETEFLLHGDRHDELDRHGDIVAWHHHLGPFRQMHHAGHVGGAEVELGTVIAEERGVTPALLLGEDIGLGLELGMRLDRARLAQHLAALDAFAIDAAEQAADIVAGLALVEQLAEHLDA